MGCTQGPTSDADPASDADPTGVPTPQADSGRSEEELTALELYFPSVLDIAPAEESRERSALIEEGIARCMAERGFEYYPVDRSDNQVGQPLDVGWGPLDVGWGTAEFAAQYGYGASTDPYGTAGITPTTTQEPPAGLLKNQACMDAMSTAEQSEYLVSRYGTWDRVPDAEPYDWTRAGSRSPSCTATSSTPGWRRRRAAARRTTTSGRAAAGAERRRRPCGRRVRRRGRRGRRPRSS